MLQNFEHLYLVYQCKRAGTVQILDGHDYDSFVKTMAVIKNKPPLDVSICHIYPVRGNGRIGLLHHENLFYGGRYQNCKLGNRSFGGGRSIHHSRLLQEWDVGVNDTVNEVLIKVERFLGPIIERYLENVSVRKSPKAALIGKIVELDPKRAVEDLMLAPCSQLLTIMQFLTRQTQFKVSRPKRASKYLNYIDELTRFISYQPAKCRYLRIIRRLMVIGYICLAKERSSSTHNAEIVSKYKQIVSRYHNACLKEEVDWSEFKDFMYDTAFFALQGKRGSIVSLILTFVGYIDVRSIRGRCVND
jgi:hypothetical protein